MCIEKHLALYAKSKNGYIKHLEEALLDNDMYHRCDSCGRVAYEDDLVAVGDYWVCEGHCENSLDKIAGSNEDTYRKYKITEYGR